MGGRIVEDVYMKSFFLGGNNGGITISKSFLPYM